MGYIPKPKNCYLNKFNKYKVINGRQVYTSGRLLYSWDELHGEIEVFDKRGYHLGALDAIDGTQIKPPKKGRCLNV